MAKSNVSLNSILLQVQNELINIKSSLFLSFAYYGPGETDVAIEHIQKLKEQIITNLSIIGKMHDGVIQIMDKWSAIEVESDDFGYIVCFQIDDYLFYINGSGNLLNEIMPGWLAKVENLVERYIQRTVKIDKANLLIDKILSI